MHQPRDTPLAKSVAKSKAAPKNLSLQLPPPQSPSLPLSPLVSPRSVPPIVAPEFVLDPIATPDTPLTASDITESTSTPKPKPERQSSIDSASRLQIQNYLHTVSGQLKIPIIQELEHDYAKPCHIHPDPQIRAHAAKFLFMKNFPRHLNRPNYSAKEDDLVDIISFEEQKKIPFLTPRPPSLPVTVDEEESEIDTSITDSWTCEKNKLWTRANKIINADRIARLSCEGHVNEVLLKRNLQEQTANKFRELFASTFWEPKLVNWLHNTLLEYLNSSYKNVYLDSLQILKHKIPTLIDTFYSVKTENKTKPLLNDPLFNTLSHYKLKKLPRKPIFLIIPSGPSSAAHQSLRVKYWHSMFSSMGKVVSLSTVAKANDFISDILLEIRCLANEKIRNTKNVFANRPLILVGFNYGSIIAAHCALQNLKSICAIVCLGFPLKGTSGIRGELDDPLLEMTVPMQFIIGENAVMTSLDDIEDFRERMTKTETSLVVVGGADDKLVVSNLKKRLECLTQSMVDRCVADEVFYFLSAVLLNYNEDSALGTDIKPLHFLINPSDPFQIPKPKKKASKKRTAQPSDGSNPLQGPADPNAEKPPPKKKRTSKPKAPAGPKPELNPVLLSNPALMASLPLQSQMFPNLTSVLNSSAAEKLNTDTHQMKPLIGPIKVENSKFVIADPTKALPVGVLPSPIPKKNTKKAVGNGAVMQNLMTLPPIKEEASPLKSELHPPTAQATTGNSSALQALLKSPIPKPEPLLKRPDLEFHQQSTSSKSVPLNPYPSQASMAQLLVAPSTVPSPSLADGRNIVPATCSHKDSYPVSEVPHIHPSSTRTGRPIKPPKSLDF